MDVRGVLDKRTVAKVEESLVNLKLVKPMPLYINLSYVNVSDSQGLRVLLEILCRLQARYAYIQFIDNSNKTIAHLRHYGAESMLRALLPDYTH